MASVLVKPVGQGIDFKVSRLWDPAPREQVLDALRALQQQCDFGTESATPEKHLEWTLHKVRCSRRQKPPHSEEVTTGDRGPNLHGELMHELHPPRRPPEPGSVYDLIVRHVLDPRSHEIGLIHSSRENACVLVVVTTDNLDRIVAQGHIAPEHAAYFYDLADRCTTIHPTPSIIQPI